MVARARRRRATALAAGAALAALPALAACRGGEGAGGDGTGGDPPTLAPVPGDTLLFAMRDVRLEEGCRAGAATGDSANVELAPCVTVELRFPDSVRAAVPALADSVRAFVRRSAFGTDPDSAPAATGEAAAAAFLRQYDEAYRETPGPWQLWYLETTVAVACNTPRLVGLRAEGSQHTGGAHPISWAHLASFDARTGGRLDAAALFLPESLPALTRLAERAFREARELPAGQSLEDAGFAFFPDGRFVLPPQLLACPDSVSFYFAPYEVAPYALGPTSFALPLSAVRPLLRLGTPLSPR